MSAQKLKECLNTNVQGIKERDISMYDIELVSTSNYFSLTSNALNIIKENLKNQPMSFQFFDVVKSPSKGLTVFSVPELRVIMALKN